MFVRRAWLAFFLRGGCSLHCVGWRVGLAPRIVPSVEQANSAIFCSRMSQILHHVHSQRLAHTQTVPEHQEGSFPFGNAAGVLVLGVSLEQLKGDLFGPQCTAQMGKSPRVSELVMHVQNIKQLLTRWKGLLHRFQTARREGGEKTKVQPERGKKPPAQIRNEEKIGKRVMRKKNNGWELGNGGTNMCMRQIRPCRNR